MANFGLFSSIKSFGTLLLALTKSCVFVFDGDVVVDTGDESASFFGRTGRGGTGGVFCRNSFRGSIAGGTSVEEKLIDSYLRLDNFVIDLNNNK